MVEALADAERPVLYAGGGVTSALAEGAPELLTELAELLEVPVAHTLMGKGCLPDGHPLLAGQTGFWGTPIANLLCRQADTILAIGTRLAEANSSSWDPRYTFSIPPTRLMHIDIDAMEIGRNYPTFLGAVSDSKLALQQLVSAARQIKPRLRADVRSMITESQRKFKSNFVDHTTSNAFPLRPERILNDLRNVLPEDGYVVTDVDGIRMVLRSSFRSSMPAPSSLQAGWPRWALEQRQ